ncbi:MAG TPA: isoamylase early set domain-containing protein [Candidatus Acidoferrales bacterium]|nr:isoamylase early set domain-containing protein [Candidatus Acidoferrales bacterium]
MALKKQYLKNKPGCKVTFTLPKEAAKNASEVYVVGDFNEWNTSTMRMKKLKNGSFTFTTTLERGKEYRFRYLLDGTTWENDWHADKYVSNEFGGENSVVVV